MHLNYNEIQLVSAIQELTNNLLNENFVKDKSGVNLVEIINFSATLDPRQKIIEFPGVRKTPEEYVKREIEWYESQDLSVEEISKHAKIWANVADKDGRINSNYGWLIWSKENGEQYENAIAELISFPTSRKGIMIYTRPSMWTEWNKDGMSDFICTISSQYFIRNNKLINIVNMRSNDFIFGFFNDFYWQSYVYDKVYNRLVQFHEDLEYGEIIWNANSMHVYERHFEMLKSLTRLVLSWKDNMRKERRNKNLRKHLKEKENE